MARRIVTTIFVLTCMMMRPGARRPERTRTWGWFKTLSDAEASIFSNATDMYEMGYYNTVVLEEMLDGAIATANSEHWYNCAYTPEDDSYRVTRIAKPECLCNIVGFGMG